MEPDKKGPDYIPFSEWQVIDEKRRRRRNLLLGSTTAIVVLGIFTALMIPILNRRALINDLAFRFSRVEQVITIEERVGPNDLRFDRRVIEEAGQSRRTELEEGNLVLFSNEGGGSRWDKKRGVLTKFANGDSRPTPLMFLQDLLSTTSKDVRASVQKAQMRNGALRLAADNLYYLVRPGEGSVLATVEVQMDTDLGPTTLRRWRFEKVTPDITKFYSASITPLSGQPVDVADPAWPQMTFATPHGGASIVALNVNDKGDIFIFDSATYRVSYRITTGNDAHYSLMPSGTSSQSIDRPGETQRQLLAYRKRGTALTWPLQVVIEARPEDTMDVKPTIIKHTFAKPTCSIVPDYEYSSSSIDYPIIAHRMRSYLAEASIAETGFGSVLFANADGPVRDPVQALTFYRFAFTYYAADVRGAGARTYYSIYRCYDALNQTERAIAALKMAADRNNGRDPWLDQKINEAFLREGLVEAE